MFFYGQVRYEQVVLRAQPQRVPDGFHVGLDVVALDQGRAGRGTYQSSQHGHGGGFSGAVMAQQNGYLVRIDVQGQFIDG